MTYSRFKSAVFAGLAIVGLVTSMLVLPVKAEDNDNMSAALGITPRKDYTVKPGERIKDTIRIQNIDNQNDLELNLRVVDFTYTDETGTPKLLLEESEEPQTTWSLRPYLEVPQTVRIPAKGSKSIDISLKMPAGHGAGSYYSAIVYSTGTPGEVVGLNASGTTLVFAKVPGKVKQQLELEKLGLYREASAEREAGYEFITTKSPATMAFTLNNKGNVTEAPVGSMTIKGLFGREHVIDDVNPRGLLALIDQTRTFTTCIKPKTEEVEFDGAKTQSIQCQDAGLLPGYYKVSLEAYYGDNDNITQEVIGTSSFWYLPIWFLAVLLVVVLALGLGIYRIRQRFDGSSRRRSRRR